MVLLVVVGLVVVQIQVVGSAVGIEQIIGVALVEAVAVNVSQHSLAVAAQPRFGYAFPGLVCYFFARKDVGPHKTFFAKISPRHVKRPQIGLGAVNKSVRTDF